MPLIFVIEDNDTLRQNTEMLLNIHGFESMGYQTGEEAIKALRFCKPDLVLCDVLMPGMIGYEVLAEFRSRSDTATIPFIFNLQPAQIELCPVCFHRMISELIDNAFKFSSPSQWVEVSCAWRSLSRAWVVSIRDQGIGMRDEEIQSLSAFRQFEREIQEQQGMGLGLALSMALACGHGWKIELESQPTQSGILAELVIAPESIRHPSCVCPAYFDRMAKMP